MAKAAKKPTPFSPYQCSANLGGQDYSGGINWSYVCFDSELVADKFAEQCGQHGYRTRNKTCKVQASGPNLWIIQYHHYAE
jgi:hypothetical protein